MNKDDMKGAEQVSRDRAKTAYETLMKEVRQELSGKPVNNEVVTVVLTGRHATIARFLKNGTDTKEGYNIIIREGLESHMSYVMMELLSGIVHRMTGK